MFAGDHQIMKVAHGKGGDLRSGCDQVVPMLPVAPLSPNGAAFYLAGSQTPKTLHQWKICIGDFCFLMCLKKASRSQQRELVNPFRKEEERKK